MQLPSSAPASRISLRRTLVLAGLALVSQAPLLARSAAPAPVAQVSPATPLQTVEVSLKELTEVKYEPGQPLPKKIRDLNGKDILITGIMHSDTGYDVKTFLLVTEACECAASPQPNHFVEVTLTSGRTSRKRGELSFRGTFSVGEELDENGFVKSLYRLDGDFF